MDMKRLCMLAVIALLCVGLISCSYYLYQSVSGEIIDPVEGFSRGSEEGTFLLGGKRYILIDEFSGDFEFYITDEDVFLGATSNFPFFPNFHYYANAAEEADYIACGGSGNGIMTVAYLREDLYPICYRLEDAAYEFDFSSAFVKTEEVSYQKHIEGKEYHGTELRLCVKDYPKLKISIHIAKINEKWYYVKHDEAFALSESFVNVLEENHLLS